MDNDVDSNCIIYLAKLNELHSEIEESDFWVSGSSGYVSIAVERPFCDPDFNDDYEDTGDTNIYNGECVDWYCYIDSDGDGSYDSSLDSSNQNVACKPVRPCITPAAGTTLTYEGSETFFTTYSGKECRPIRECDSTDSDPDDAIYMLTRVDGEDCVRETSDPICTGVATNALNGVLITITGSGSCKSVQPC